MRQLLAPGTGRRLAGWLLATVVATVAAGALLPQLAFNATASLPGSLYWLCPLQEVERDQVVALRPPANRFYPPGMRFLKRIEGLPGDRVSWLGRQVRINGRPLGRARTASRDGRPLPRGPAGVIPPGHYFVWTPHRDSYDSRYADIGWVARERVLARAVRLL